MEGFEGGTSGQQIRPEDGEAEMTDFRDLSGDRTVQGYITMERLGGDGENGVEWNTVLNQDGPDVFEELHLQDVQVILDDVLRLEEQCRDPRFVRWLIWYENLEVDRTDGHKFSYYGMDVDGDVTWNAYRTFNVGEISDEDWSLARREIRECYDDWVKHENRKVMRRAGLLAGIGLGVIALVTVLALGLKRAGNDIQHRPRPGPGPGTPWTEIEDTARKIGGGILVWIGDHPFRVIGGIVLYVRSRRG